MRYSGKALGRSPHLEKKKSYESDFFVDFVYDFFVKWQCLIL